MATASGGAEKRYGADDGGPSSVVRIGARRPPWRTAVGTVLRDWRTDQGLRLSDVADRARVSVQYLSEVERGRKEPSSEVLGAVTEALGGSLTDLALGVARRLTATEDRRAARPTPARAAPVRELRALTPSSSSLRVEPAEARQGGLRGGLRGEAMLLAA